MSGEPRGDQPVDKRRRRDEPDEVPVPVTVEDVARRQDEELPAERERGEQPVDCEDDAEEDGEVNCREEHPRSECVLPSASPAHACVRSRPVPVRGGPWSPTLCGLLPPCDTRWPGRARAHSSTSRHLLRCRCGSGRTPAAHTLTAEGWIAD